MYFDLKGFLTVLLEIFCCKIFFETYQKNIRVNKVKFYGLFLLLVLLAYTTALILADYFLLKQFFIIFFMAIVMKAYLAMKWRKAFALALLYQSILLIVDYCVFSILSFSFLDYQNQGVIYDVVSTLVVTIGKICLFLIVLLLNRKMKHTADAMADSQWIRFLFFPVLTIGMISAMISAFSQLENQNQSDVLFLIAFGLVGMNVTVFYMMNDILRHEHEKQENEIFLLQAKSQTDMYRSISENLDRQKKRTHEYKNQVMCMAGLLKQNNYEELDAFINKLCGTLKKEKDAINTNHVFINAILNTKYQEAIGKGIVFVIRVNDLSRLRIQDEDIVIMLSNLLNNAIEAAEKCPWEKLVKLKFVIEGTDIILAVRNTYSNQIIIEDDEYHTTKSHKENHGIGIKNIISMVKKYGGDYAITNEDNEFSFMILIPIQ